MSALKMDITKEKIRAEFNNFIEHALKLHNEIPSFDEAGDFGLFIATTKIEMEHLMMVLDDFVIFAGTKNEHSK